MIPLEEVQARVLAAAAPLEVVELRGDEAVGAALATAVRAPGPVPPFDNSAMDGYALRAADTAGAPVSLRVVGEVAAGAEPEGEVGRGEAVRIMTGAPMPPGADAVVMQERTRRRGEQVTVEVSALEGDHVRRAGGDLARGDVVLAAGDALTPARLGVLASIGTVHVRVHRRARVGVLSTGDELVEPGTVGALPPGSIYDSNRPMLLALVRETGAAAVDLGTVGDHEAETVARLEAGAADCDVVLTSGGVSVGVHDHVAAAVGQLGEYDWHQLAIKPAKPFAFGRIGATLVFGLPGNPVSSLVSYELLVRPAVLALMGHRDRFRPVIEARAEHDLTRRRDGKTHYDRVRLTTRDGVTVASRSGAQASNVLSATAAAHGLARIPDGEGIPAGSPVSVLLLHAAPDH